VPHESLDGQTPAARWEADRQSLRFPEDDDELRNYFVVTEGRTVSKDHVIQYGGLDYEAPRGLGGSRIEVHRRVLDGELYLLHDGRAVRLQPVDRQANARSGRARQLEPVIPASGEGVPRTAATIAFNRDHGPLVDAEGGFKPPERED
jgi:hypothetical protein